MMKDLENMSNLTSPSCDQASVSSTNNGVIFLNQSQPLKRKRNQPGNPDPNAEVVALSPKSLLATNKFVCEICKKGFQREQNLQLHRRGHNLPWNLKPKSPKEVRKKVYVCPERSCVHHHPSRALGDLTGIKKHFCRKHGEKKWKCEKCSKKYAVRSDWKAHFKTCGTKEYTCDCGTIFSRRDSFITHRAFCDAHVDETSRSINGNKSILECNQIQTAHFDNQHEIPFPIKKEPIFRVFQQNPNFHPNPMDVFINGFSATTTLGDNINNNNNPLSTSFHHHYSYTINDIMTNNHGFEDSSFEDEMGFGMTRDFLGLRPLSHIEILSIFNNHHH